MKKLEELSFDGVKWQKYSKKQNLFEEISASLSKHENVFEIKGKPSIYRIISVTNDVYYSNPLLYDFNKIEDIKPHGRKTKITVSWNENYPREKYDKEIEKRIMEISQEIEIEKKKTDLEKEIAVNDWLVNNCVWQDGDDFNKYHSVLGILLFRTGVCASFAMATTLLLKCFDVECYTVIGDFKKDHYPKELQSFIVQDFVKNHVNESLIYKNERIDCKTIGNYDINKIIRREKALQDQTHAWNVVKTEGRYRHLDVTFNAGGDAAYRGVHKHDYFNLTEKEMLEERNLLFAPNVK